MDAIEALGRVAFRTHFTMDDVWRGDALHVPGLHEHSERMLLALMERLARGDSDVPHVVVQGRPGIGKTHFLGTVRQALAAPGQLFVLYQPGTTHQFWEGLVGAVRDSLHHRGPEGRSQLSQLLQQLLERTGMDADQAAEVLRGEVSRTALAAVRKQLHGKLGKGGSTQLIVDVALALMLDHSDDIDQSDLGADVLQGYEIEPRHARAHSLSGHPLAGRDVIRAFDRILGLAGVQALLAVDQLDTLIPLAQGRPGSDESGDDGLAGIAVGLMDLAQDVGHCLIVLSCLVDSWHVIGEAATAVRDRFPTLVKLDPILDENVGVALAREYLARSFGALGFEPPDELWPIARSAFADATLMTPRDLLNAIQMHCRSCHVLGEVTRLERFDAIVDDKPKPPLPPPDAESAPVEIDERFERLRAETAGVELVGAATVDDRFPEVLREVLLLWAEENVETGRFLVDPAPSRKPELHARIRQRLSETTEEERHWSFRAIPHDNANAALSRLRQAATAAGVAMNGDLRRLIIFRNTPWSAGKKTQLVVGELVAAGALVREITDDELSICVALARLRAEAPEGWSTWLRVRRPASRLACLAILAADVGLHSPRAAPPATPDTRDTPDQTRPPGAAVVAPDARREPEAAAGEPGLLLGHTLPEGDPVRLPISELRRHTVIFGGSGSGKTVFLRRLVEGCALAGVSAIVLDVNNDLARLGDPWPTPPEHWLEGDAALANAYHDQTDVVVWTPRRDDARPIAFDPLQGLTDLRDDAAEFTLAVENAVTALMPRSGLPQSGRKRQIGQAVHTQALAHFVRNGAHATLEDYIGFLEALPGAASTLANAVGIAADMAQALRAAVVTDPLFGGTGTHTDPGLLLAPAAGKKARISVISLIGLPQEEQRSSFVAQLQMALFAWFKKNPAGERPLGGLLVMDEAQNYAPSGSHTACTGTTLALAQQARKYGLGLVFATQAPKSLHNQVTGNADVQCFGKLNAPAQISVAIDLTSRRGGDASDIVRLRAGQFLVSSEALGFRKLQAPNCLSHHPSSPLAPDEVLARARR